MYKKIKGITILILIICLDVGAVLYLFPWPTSVKLSLNAAKLDENGNVVGHTTINIQGTMDDYLFREDVLNVTISPFDEYNWFKLVENNPGHRKGVIQPHSKDCVKVHCYYYDGLCDLLFTKDFKYVAFVVEHADKDIYYVASTDEQVSTEELVEYFRYLPPFG
jgi:hypothetical protein